MADEDLEQLTTDELLAEVKKLRAGIRRHRDSTGYELCWRHGRVRRRSKQPRAKAGAPGRRTWRIEVNERVAEYPCDAVSR
jgi:hypothetical protein